MIQEFLNININPSSIVSFEDGSPITKAEFVAQVHATASQWEDQQWEKIGIYWDSGANFAISLLAAWLARKHPVVLPDNNIETINHASTSVDVFTGNLDVENKVENYAENTGSKQLEISINPSITIFTSGSSGEPKAITKTFLNFKHEFTVLDKMWGSESASLTISTVSHQHVYGLIFKILWPLFSGNTFISSNLKYPEQVAGVLNEHIDFEKILVSSPAFLTRSNDSIHNQTFSTIFSSGGLLDKQTSLFWQMQFNCDLFEIFGSSETGGIAYRHQQESKIKDYWKLLPGVKAKSDEKMLIINSPYCYKSGWYASSDIVEWQENEEFEFIGRSDEIVKIEEKRVSLNSINNYLAQHDFVDSVASACLRENRVFIGVCIKLTSPGKMYLYSKGKYQLNSLFKSYLNRAFESVALPRRWRYVDSLPRNLQGKVLKKEITEILQNADSLKFPEMLRLQQDNDKLEIELYVPDKLVYFQGHFAEQAVLAGVVQIAWVVEYANTMFDISISGKRLKQIKFQRPILPNTTLLLIMFNNKELNGVSFKYSQIIKDDLIPCSSGNLMYT